MKIARLEVDGCRGLPDGKLSFLGGGGDPHPILAITGPRAAGKTTLLETIVAGKESVAPYGQPADPHGAVRREGRAAKVAIEWRLSAAERARFGVEGATVATEAILGGFRQTQPAAAALVHALLARYSTDPASGKVEYFHAGRRLPLGGFVSLTTSSGGVDASVRLRRTEEKYRGLVDYMVEAGLGLDRDEEGKPREQGRVSRAFASLCSTKRLAGVFRLESGIAPVFTDSANIQYTLAQLSASEQDALLFAATFVRCGLAGSVILIDTPEMYIGDEDAWSFLQALSTLAPDNQFIVATRARSILSALGPDQIVRLGAP